jgi:hypothetical protein
LSIGAVSLPLLVLVLLTTTSSDFSAGDEPREHKKKQPHLSLISEMTEDNENLQLLKDELSRLREERAACREEIRRLREEERAGLLEQASRPF